MLTILLAALLSSALARHKPHPPTRGELERALASTAHAWVQVSGPEATGPGIVVGQDGEVLTSVHFVALEHAQVRLGTEHASARVLAASAALGTAVVRPEHAFGTLPVPVRPLAELQMGGWLIAVRGHHVQPVRILSVPPQSPFIELADTVPPGTALLDAQGALVAFVVRRRRATSTAVLISAVKAQLAAGTR